MTNRSWSKSPLPEGRTRLKRFEAGGEPLQEWDDPQTVWKEMIERHLFRHVRDMDPLAEMRLRIAPDRRFRGSLHSGVIGSLQYSRMWCSHGRYEHACTPQRPAQHAIVLQVSGTAVFETPERSLSSNAGDFVMVSDMSRLSLENDDAAEWICVFNPLPPAEFYRLGGNGLIRRPARSDVDVMLMRWLQDACADRGWYEQATLDSVDAVLRALLRDSMREMTLHARPRLDRATVEWEVAQRLQDPGLSIGSLADVFQCSVRSLHRLFQREGDESLERYIQRQRVETCARRLRAPDSSMSLTELALDLGFSSSSHFSTVFRAHYGMPPSVYRRMFSCQDHSPQHELPESTASCKVG